MSSAPSTGAGHLPFQFTRESDLYNQGEAVKYFEDKFYENNRGVLLDDQLQQANTLRLLALEEPSLSLAAAQVLYMFCWFSSTGQILRDNIVAAAQLFDQSIGVSRCGADRSAEDWNEDGCDMRWFHAVLLYNWLGDTEGDPERSQAFKTKAYQGLAGLKQAARFASISHNWLTPSHINFNSIIFPRVPSRPIWDTQQMPMGRFLEESHHVFREELQAIIDDPRDLYKQLMNLDPSREHLANPGAWDTLRIVRYHHWYDIFCEAAPRTCELIKSRPEIMKCPFMNVNYVKLNPGAHLKPHFGNGPRLSAHLSVIAPEPMRAGMTVGDERRLWQEGKAIIFDDTYPHCVSHWGAKPRFVMLVWFCHPCDENHPHEQTCPETL
eukprot:gnl/TRDRNA2_/TRDRNA2_200721_c0_seq1.p1 gnl/TRDRNA2_/TRDRNA2_200721_c0~~gnl/TRDRNA2_/TRDRNA2_200721_c0_seq1.p1  ORF type:complete len:432 (-),score=60.07 gnl/TRDRNA2_/TRDRNA2_200721_c0_seq1:60-1202(-)